MANENNITHLSRPIEADYFNEDGFTTRIGCSKEDWHLTIIKELIDNALDSAEQTQAHPEIHIDFNNDRLMVIDNGGGIPDYVVKKAIDFKNLVSSNNGKIRPSRGRIGHALKCVMTMPLILHKQAHIEIISQEKHHNIYLSFDVLTGKPLISLDTKTTNLVKNTNIFKINSFFDSTFKAEDNFHKVKKHIENMAVLNSHTTFSFRFQKEGFKEHSFKYEYFAEIKRWTADKPLVAHWFDAEQLKNYLQTIYNENGNYPINKCIAGFQGLTHSKKQKEICEYIGIASNQGIEAVLYKSGAVESMLEKMKGLTKTIKPQELGFLDEQLIKSFENQEAGINVRHCRKEGLSSEQRPFTLDVIFEYGNGVNLRGYYNLAIALNHSVLINGDIEKISDNDNYRGKDLDAIFNELNLDEWEDKFKLLIHIESPFFKFTSQGKNSVTLDNEMFTALEKALKAVAGDWKKIKKGLSNNDKQEEIFLNSFTLPTKSDETGMRAFAKILISIQETMDFKAGSRGWCYILEESIIKLSKSNFNTAQKLITECRKQGCLPIDFTAEDEARRLQGGDHTIDNRTPEEFYNDIIEELKMQYLNYHPVNLHTFLKYGLVIGVEKIDLVGLFKPVCDYFHLPIFNARGWSDVNSRDRLIKYFKEQKESGRECICLYCGDHDPGGFNISKTFKKNLKDLEKAVGFSTNFIKIERFGLNYDFIKKHNLSWIENLDTKSKHGSLDNPKHPDHNKDYVQNYIKEFGVRKCEANSLVVRPEAGRQLLRDTILNYVKESQLEDYKKALAEEQRKVKEIIESNFKFAA